MKNSFHSSVLVVFTLVLLMAACNKDEVDPITPQLPGQPSPPVPQPAPPITQPNLFRAPTAHAGNDTVIYTPFASGILDGSASTDPDHNIASFQWRLVSGPSAAAIPEPDRVKPYIGGLRKLGKYIFELIVTDSDNLSSKDTVVVTIAEPPCTSSNKEILFENLSWNYSWIMEINIFGFNTHLPPNSHILYIYIKRDSSDEWETVLYLNDSPDYSMHTWAYGNEVLAIFPHDNMEDDTPDLKIVYCH